MDGRVPNIVGRFSVIALLVFALSACAPWAGVPDRPAAEPGGALGPSAGEQASPAQPPRGASAVTPRAASSVQRGFPFGELKAEWYPAGPWNYERGRYGYGVNLIVIHYTAISYERTLRAFRNPASGVSAHYVVRHDGHVAQMVSEDDTAWQAGDAWYNLRSVGIEIELAPGESNAAFTAEQYYATAALACGIAARHGLPLDRTHVIGHSEVPGVGKIDPGPTFDWPHFMWLTSLCAPPRADGLKAGFLGQTPFPVIGIDEQATFSVKLRNDGAVAWRKGGSSEVRLALTFASRDQTLVGSGWPLPDRPAVQQEDIVAPGGTATFSFTVRGATPGDFFLRLRPVVDGVAWLPDLGLYTVVQVKDSRIRAAHD